MMLTQLSFILLALVAGALLPVQSALNAHLSRWTPQPVIAALISFLVGTLGLVIYAVFTGGFSGLTQLSGGRMLLSEAPLFDAPWWAWVGGLLGAFYVAAAVVLMPRLGSATLVVVVIAGQLLISMILDHFGWLGVPIHAFSWGRFGGAILLMLSVFMIQRF